MKAILLALLLLPALSSASLVSSNPAVTTSRVSTLSPARYVRLESLLVTAANAAVLRAWTYSGPGSARLVDVVITQATAGTGGTSWSVDVRNAAGTSLLTTTGTATLASGAQKTDASGEFALPSGWTRPVIKTDSTIILAKGDQVYIYCTESGTYSAHAGVHVNLVLEPLQ